VLDRGFAEIDMRMIMIVRKRMIHLIVDARFATAVLGSVEVAELQNRRQAT